MVLWKKSLSGYYRYTIAYNTSTDNGQSWQSTDRFALENGSPEDIFFSASGGTGPNISLVYLTYVSPDIVFYSIRSTDFGGELVGPQRNIPGPIFLGTRPSKLWRFGAFRLAGFF